MPAPKSILVTGDIVRETHVYQGSRTFAVNPCDSGTRLHEGMGGADLLRAILEAAQPGVSLAGLKVDRSQPWPGHLQAHALYVPGAEGFKSDPKPAAGDKPKKVWRVSQTLGYGFDSAVPPVEPPVKVLPAGETKPRVLLIDDGAAGFRSLRAKGRWPDAGDEQTTLPRWVVLKMSQPLGEGHLWRHLVAKCTGASQLVVVVSADELRRDGAAINRGLSWERTVADTCQILAQHPRLSRLRQAAHLLVVFRREGALWIRRGGHPPGRGPSSAPSDATLVFDPRLAEGQWKTLLNDEQGQVFGHLSVFTAAIALELAEGRSSANFETELLKAMQRGLAATRELCLHGHGMADKKTAPSFPFPAIAHVLNGTSPGRQKHQPPDEFVSLPFSTSGADARWIIAARNDVETEPTPLYGLGFQTAIYGPERLSEIPQARFGELLTVDRAEIETLRGLRQTIQAYEQGGRQKQPLCLGAFGPPGSGKSFGIKQIACEILGADVPFLEFNLSQFDNAADLIGAFHQVRDKVLAGRTPVVFWDEFDAENLRWLQFLLAPMQDGKFQSGQLTHTLGKCIFVFAGATSWDLEHFGPAPEPANESEANVLKKYLGSKAAFQEARRQAREEFRLKKGPDFVSRLNGHINVPGPNRRMLFNFATRAWDQPDRSDVTFPVRRALLLRSFLKVPDTDPLKIDGGLLNALLRLPGYRHGTRSMEKVVEPLRTPHAPLSPAQLPSPQVLAQHLDSSETFQKLLAENTAFLTPKNWHALAAAIHENYRRLTDRKYIFDARFRDRYDRLDAWGRATNLAAASGIPHVLAVAGMCVVPGQAGRDELAAARKRLQRYLEPLRREEHARWMNALETNGWQQTQDKEPATGGPLRDNARLLHRCMLPFDKLDEADQKKDDQTILSLPDTVAIVGFKLALVPDLTLPLGIPGVSGKRTGKPSKSRRGKSRPRRRKSKTPFSI